MCIVFVLDGIFRPIQIQYTVSIHCCCVCRQFFSGRNFPAGKLSPMQIQYTFTVVVSCLVFIFRPELSGRNIPSNTNTIYMYCPFVLSGRNIPSNTNTIHNDFSLSLSARNFPAGKLSPIQIQYTFIVVVSCLLFIFRPEFSGRNIPFNTNTIHIIVVVFVLYLFSGRNFPYCVCYVIFRPEYSVLHILC